MLWNRLLAGAGVIGSLACGGWDEADGEQGGQAASPAGDPPGGLSGPEGSAGTKTAPQPLQGTPSEAGAQPTASGGLPDLVLDAAYLLDSTRFDVQRIDDPCAVQQGCATGVGERRVVRFGSRMGNIGNADFVLGTPDADNPLWSVDSCRMSPSLAGFARYELSDADTGQLLLVGNKDGFCITDSEEWIPDGGASCHTYTCNRQGIRPGCADNYGTDLPCQWVDVTDVPPGTYQLRVTLNAQRSVEELDYANNAVTLQLHIDVNGGSVVR